MQKPQSVHASRSQIVVFRVPKVPLYELQVPLGEQKEPF